MLTISAYAANSASAPLAPTTIGLRDLGPRDVLIDISFSGVCHSDLHVVHGDWGPTTYPVVPGHEIAGTVAAVGSAVRRFAPGDRVGVGCMVDACGECTACVAGEENHCRVGNVQTYNGTGRDGLPTHGGYAQAIVVTEAFVLAIPDALGLDVAAPLMCAGISLYSPLRRWGAGPGRRVGIIGLGGLGHVGVQIARAMGARVSVLSRSADKRADALALGAHQHHATSDPEEFRRLAGSFDLLVNTVSAAVDLDAYLSLLALGGTLVNLGAPEEPLSLNVFSLLSGRRSFAGSTIGGIRETQEMLEFCATHAIGAQVEVIPVDRVNEAFTRIENADVRYRFVIDASTFDDRHGETS